MLRIARLCQERNLWEFQAFDIALAAARKRAAAQDNNPDLLSVTVSRRTFDRWTRSGVGHKPRWETGRVLSYMFDAPAEELMQEEDDDDLSGLRFGAGLFNTVGRDRSTASVFAPVNPALLDLAERKVNEIVNLYEVLGPQQLSREAAFMRSMLHGLLEGQQPHAQGERLIRLAGQTAGLLGYMAVNAGKPAEAERHLSEATSAAAEAQDTDLMMWAQGTRSFSYYYSGEYAKADAAARAGIALAPNSPQAIRLLINGRARALARLGRHRAANQAIEAALALSNRHDLPDGVTSCISLGPYSLSRTLANAVTAHLSLGDAGKVFEYAREVAPMVASSKSAWSRALVGLDMATAHLRAPDVDVEQAMSLGATALSSGGAPPIRSVYQRGGELLKEASPWRAEPAVREYAERLRAWEASPLASEIAAAVPVD